MVEKIYLCMDGCFHKFKSLTLLSQMSVLTMSKNTILVTWIVDLGVYTEGLMGVDPQNVSALTVVENEFCTVL